MSNLYVGRATLKRAMSIDATSTGDHGVLDSISETVARLIDDYAGFHFYEGSATRHFTAIESRCLRLDYPLLTVGSIQFSSDGGTTYGTTMTTADYYLAPYNAAAESPPRPYWEIESRDNATSSGSQFPKGIQRGVKIAGTWGYYNQTRSTSASISTAIASDSTTWEIANATALQVGMTLLSGTEKVFVTRTPASASGAHTSTIDVLRGQNWTTNSTHSSASALLIYEYPIIEQAALTQCQQEYLVRHSPNGYSGGEPFGAQRPQMSGGLHPFVRRMLDQFRTPVAI